MKVKSINEYTRGNKGSKRVEKRIEKRIRE